METSNLVTIKCRGIIVHNGKLFVVKHNEHAQFRAFPGGHLEGKENPRECVKREIFEELGIVPEIGKLAYINFYENKENSFLEFLFEVKNGADFYGKKKFTGSHNFELFDFRWISKDEKLDFLPKKVFEDFKNDTLFSGEVQFVN